MTVPIALLALLTLGAPHVHASHVEARETGEDYLVTHVLNVPLAMTKLLVEEFSVRCRLTAADHTIRGGNFGESFGVNATGAVSRTATMRLRISETSGGAPYQGAVKVRCEVRPTEGRFRLGEPPAPPAGTSGRTKTRGDEYLQPGPTLTPEGAIVVEGTFP